MKHHVFISIIAALLFVSGCTQHEESSKPVANGGGSVTLWTNKTELFMEYPALLVEKEVRFAVHLTWISNFKAVTEGELTLEFTSSDGSQFTASTNSPTSPGIFRPTITFNQAGTFHLTMVLSGAETDTLEIENLQVYSSESDIPEEAENSSGEALITYLKEQQWKTDFRTETVRQERISNTIHAAGEIVPKLNAEAIVAAPFTGYIPAEKNLRLPVPGSQIERGTILALMMPSAETPGGNEDFASRFTDAETERDLAKRELERAKKLYAIQGLSEKELQEAESEFRRAVATYNTLSGYIQTKNDSSLFSLADGFQLIAPISGTISEFSIVPGKQVNAGEPLFRIIDTKEVWVRVNVPVTDIGKVSHPQKAWMQISGVEEPLSIDEQNGKLISVGNVVEEMTRTVPVIFQVNNFLNKLRIGMIGEVHISTGNERDALVVPESSLIEEEGRYSVYVHVEGEAFAKREVQLGAKEADRVEIISGILEGERVVTVGAYQVRLASLSSQLPAHGHAH
ncbi:MAG: efflux RND transporter periplasmic adaptor subunit [Ignavibacteriae bacterium]|nr:efflux RND transporter periplasmic adaptor subunit [Ignavibacteriota bacterium]